MMFLTYHAILHSYVELAVSVCTKKSLDFSSQITLPFKSGLTFNVFILPSKSTVLTKAALMNSKIRSSAFLSFVQIKLGGCGGVVGSIAKVIPSVGRHFK